MISPASPARAAFSRFHAPLRVCEERTWRRFARPFRCWRSCCSPLPRLSGSAHATAMTTARSSFQSWCDPSTSFWSAAPVRLPKRLCLPRGRHLHSGNRMVTCVLSASAGVPRATSHSGANADPRTNHLGVDADGPRVDSHATAADADDTRVDRHRYLHATVLRPGTLRARSGSLLPRRVQLSVLRHADEYAAAHADSDDHGLPQRRPCRCARHVPHPRADTGHLLLRHRAKQQLGVRRRRQHGRKLAARPLVRLSAAVSDLGPAVLRANRSARAEHDAPHQHRPEPRDLRRVPHRRRKRLRPAAHDPPDFSVGENLSHLGLSINANTPFDELGVSGKSPLKSDSLPLRLSLSKPRFGENRQTHPGEGAATILKT